MWYHIRVDYFDEKLKTSQTQFDYDYPMEENVIDSVLLPYLQKEKFLFAGIQLDSSNIGKVSIYSTENRIQVMKEIANERVDPRIVVVYTCQNVLTDIRYSKDVTRDIIQKAQTMVVVPQKVETNSKEMNVQKTPLLFISHSSKDEIIAEALVSLLRTIGFSNQNLFCSSVPGFDLREGENIYEALRDKFDKHNVFVIFLLSSEYYKSPACLNEMGAAWVLKTHYSTIILPGFYIQDIKGAINPQQMTIDILDSKRIRGKLTQLKERLIEFFALPETEDDTIWETDRDNFITKASKYILKE